MKIDSGKGEIGDHVKIGLSDEDKNPYIKSIEITSTANSKPVRDGFRSNLDTIIYKITLRDGTPRDTELYLDIYFPNKNNGFDNAVRLTNEDNKKKNEFPSKEIKINLADRETLDFQLKAGPLLGNILNKLRLRSSSKLLGEPITFLGPTIDISYALKGNQTVDKYNLLESVSYYIAASRTIDFNLVVEKPGEAPMRSSQTYNFDKNRGKYERLDWTDFKFCFGDVPMDWNKKKKEGWNIYPEPDF